MKTEIHLILTEVMENSFIPVTKFYAYHKNYYKCNPKKRFTMGEYSKKQ